MEQPFERLRHARRTRFKSAARFARHIDWKEGTYRHKENGTRDITPDEATHFAKYLGISPSWLLLGENHVDPDRSAVLPLSPVSYAPLLTSDEARVVLLGGREVLLRMPDSVFKTAIPVPVDRQNIVAFEIGDDSMSREIPPGFRVVVDMDDKDTINGKIYAVEHGGDLAVRRFLRDSIGARFEAEAISRRLPAIPADKIERIVGRVISVSREV